MDNALGEPQTILLLGGTSDIGLAIARSLLGPATRTLVLACRDVAAGETAAAPLRSGALRVDVVPYDAADDAAHEQVVRAAAAHGDIDVAIVAFGQLGDPDVTRTDVAAAIRLSAIDFAAPVGATIAVGNRLVEQGHGTIVVLSSVAGERVRQANPVYGGAKAGLDGFAQGYGDWLADKGVRVLVVRPGFVHSAMTVGLDPAPFACTPDVVAAETLRGLRAGSRTVWAPRPLRAVFIVMRHLPGVVWRRMKR
jgi:decaprenylphospho-beta-D-erythro-pentofuranosid-2-ulose 2-reductase